MSAELVVVPCNEVNKGVLIAVDLRQADCANGAQCRSAGIDCLFCSDSSSRLPLTECDKTSYIGSELQRVRTRGGRIGSQTFRSHASVDNSNLDEEMRATLSKAAAELYDRIRKATGD
jgi:hypothetical protein